jgi:bacteriorhodopsin
MRVGPKPPPPSIKLVALLMLGGTGLGLVAVGVTTTWGWALFIPGLVALLVSLLGIWTIQKSRDKSLR